MSEWNYWTHEEINVMITQMELQFGMTSEEFLLQRKLRMFPDVFEILV